jgi:phosphatidate phosphatase APP1
MKYLFLLFLLFCSTTAAARDMIRFYSCYGNQHELVVEGRLVKARDYNEQSPEDTLFQNFWQKMKQLVNRELKHTPLVLVTGGRKFYGKSDDEGYFSFDIKSRLPFRNGQSVEIRLPEKKIAQSCSAMILPDKPMRGVISDFDDTLVISNVTNKVKLLYTLLFENYKQRNAVAGMAEWIRKILSKNDSGTPSPFFIVTGSPRQLHESIIRFLRFHHFPNGVLITKKVHGKDAYSIFKQTDYKKEKIEKLIALFPKIKWVFFGDSGEKDREIYTQIARRYPDKTEAVYIRDVKSGKITQIKVK